MSQQRVTAGIIARLETPVGDLHTEAWGNLSEKLDDTKLHLTYGGDMIVYRYQDGPAYDAELVIFDDGDEIFPLFEEELALAGLFVVEGSAKMFVDNWYDGADAPHIDITLESAGYSK